MDSSSALVFSYCVEGKGRKRTTPPPTSANAATASTTNTNVHGIFWRCRLAIPSPEAMFPNAPVKLAKRQAIVRLVYQCLLQTLEASQPACKAAHHWSMLMLRPRTTRVVANMAMRRE